MGLFDQIAGQVLSNLPGNNNAHAGEGGLGPLIGIITSLIGDNAQGGLPGLIQSFEKAGLGSIIASWIGKGENLPITAEQIQAVLGSEQVQSIAQRFGLSTDTLTSQLAQFMPDVVDKMTPDGQASQASEGLGGLLGGILGQFTDKK